MQHGPSGAGIWSAPTVDTKLRRVYVTTGDNYSDPPTPDSDAIIAYDLGSGERLWSRQFTEGDSYNMSCNAGADKVNCPEANGPDYDFGASAMLVELEGGNRLLVAGQKSGMVHAVDPDEHGAIVWHRRVGKGGKLGGIQFGPAADSENAYVAVSDYRDPRPDSVGGITAIRLSDGSVVWDRPGFRCPAGRKGCSPAQSAAVTAIPRAVFSGSLDGFLRAYSTVDREVLWSHDTIREYWGDCERSVGQGWVDRRTGTGGRRRHGLCELRLRPVRLHSGEFPTGPRHRRRVTQHRHRAGPVPILAAGFERCVLSGFDWG